MTYFDHLSFRKTLKEIKYCAVVFWSMDNRILIENDGLLFTVFISINIAGSMLPSSRQSKHTII